MGKLLFNYMGLDGKDYTITVHKEDILSMSDNGIVYDLTFAEKVFSFLNQLGNEHFPVEKYEIENSFALIWAGDFGDCFFVVDINQGGQQ